MIISAAIVRELVTAGLQGEALCAALDRIEASPQPGWSPPPAPTPTATVPGADNQAERRRAADRERKRAARAAARENPADASADSSADIPQTSADASSCTLSLLSSLSQENKGLEEKESAEGADTSADASADKAYTTEPPDARRRNVHRARPTNSVPRLPLPADWQPSNEERAEAKDYGLTDALVDREVASFKVQYRDEAASPAGWRVMWRRWAHRAARYYAEHPERAGAAPKGAKNSNAVPAPLRGLKPRSPEWWAAYHQSRETSGATVAA